MREVCRDGDVSVGQSVAHGIGLDDGLRGQRARRDGSDDIDSDAWDAERLGDCFEDAALSAADVEDGADGKRIATQGLNEAAGIAEEAMDSGDFAVDTGRLFFRDIVAVEDLGGEGSFHCNRHESLYDNLRSGARRVGSSERIVDRIFV
jgi:hypothetical protein